jgi:Predicted membrane protein
MKKLLARIGVHNRDEFWKFVLQFVKFGIVGLSNTMISLAIYYLFVWINPGLYMWGNIVGWVVSVANAFFWSNRYVFRNEDNSAAAIAKRILKTYLTYGSTFLLATLLLYLEVQVWDISEWIAPLINLLITIPLNFFLNKLWAFKK